MTSDGVAGGILDKISQEKCVCLCNVCLFKFTLHVWDPSVYACPFMCFNPCGNVCVHAHICVCICPHGPNQVSDTFCFGSSLMDEIFICAIDQEGAGPKPSV